MSTSETMKEYLVELGYKVDGQGEQEFQGSLKGSETSVRKLSRALTAASAALTAMGMAAASRLNELHITSERVNASATNLKAFAHAVSQAGGEASGAQSAVAGLAAKLRNVPETAGFFKQMGVEVRDAHGNLKDTVKLMGELFDSEKFNSLDYAAQLKAASKIGIDDLTFRVLKTQEYREEMQKALSVQSGLTDRSAAGVRKAAKEWSDLKYKGGQALETLAGSLARTLTPALKTANGFLDAMFGWYQRLSPSARELAGSIGGVAGAILGTVAAVKTLTSVFGILMNFIKLANGAAAAAAGARAAAAGAGGMAAGGVASGAAAGTGVATLIAAGAISDFSAQKDIVENYDSDYFMRSATGGDYVGNLFGTAKEDTRGKAPEPEKEKHESFGLKGVGTGPQHISRIGGGGSGKSRGGGGGGGGRSSGGRAVDDETALMAHRIGTTTKLLKQFGDSVKRAYGDISAAQSSLNSMAEKLRNFPGFESLFKRFGVETRDMNGNMRDPIKLLVDLVASEKFKALAYYQQAAYMRALGIDDLTFRSMVSKDFNADRFAARINPGRVKQPAEPVKVPKQPAIKPTWQIGAGLMDPARAAHMVDPESIYDRVIGGAGSLFDRMVGAVKGGDTINSNNQTVTVHVDGSRNPQAVGRAVADELDRRHHVQNRNNRNRVR